jgi:hypothetical protein
MRRRSTKAERIKRLNRAVKLLRRFRSGAKVMNVLRRELGISRPQAYRYVREAQKLGKAVPVPEAQEAVVVQLPVSMSQHVRRLKRQGRGSLSGIMAKSLAAYLKRHGT